MFGLALATCATIASACSEKPRATDEVAPAKVEAPAAPTPPAPAPKPSGPLRCGDLMTADDLNAAGVDPTGYDPDKTAQPGMGVSCGVTGLAVTLFEGDQYKSLIDGLKAMTGQAGLSATEGPSVGSASQWTVMGPVSGLMFKSSDGRYAANLSATDKSVMERFARILDGRMSKR